MDQTAQIVDALWFGLWSMVIMGILGYVTHRGADDAPMRYQRWWAAFKDRYLMVRDEVGDEGRDEVDDAVAELTTLLATPVNAVAMPSNNGNALVTDNVFQGKIDALATLVKAGKVGQAEGIELVFKCSRSSRTDSPYQKARTALLPLLTPPGPQYPPLNEKQQAAREELDLPSRTP